MVVPTVLYITLSIRLIQIRKNSQKNGKISGIEMKICLQFVLILLFYFILNYIFVLDHNNELPSKSILMIAIMFYYNCNPYIYLLFDNTIREAMRKLFDVKGVCLKIQNRIEPVVLSEMPHGAHTKMYNGLNAPDSHFPSTGGLE